MAATMFDLNAYIRSAEGKARILEQKAFVANGMILQGYEQVLWETEEDQVTDEELLAFDDLDGTKEQIWFRRRQRKESRNYRKSREYQVRRAELRRVRNEIRDSIHRDKELNIPENPADLAEIKEIDKRMSKLVVLTDDLDDRTDAKLVPDTVKEEFVKALPETCDVCGVESPLDHQNPKGWLKGHKMGSHSKRAAGA